MIKQGPRRSRREPAQGHRGKSPPLGKGRWGVQMYVGIRRVGGFRKLGPCASFFSIVRSNFVFHFESISVCFYEFFYELRLVFLSVNCVLPVILRDGGKHRDVEFSV